MKPLLCIRNEPSDSMGVAPKAFQRHGMEVREVNSFDPDLVWPDLRDVAGIVAFGGDQNADEVERHPYLMPQRELLRRAVDEGVPVLGVCLGAQILARALGAAVSRSPVPEFGFYQLFPTEEGSKDDVLAAIRPGDRLFQWHRDTFDLPSRAALLATGEQVSNQAYRVGERAWGIQFHPEITQENLEIWFSMLDPAHVEVEWGRSLDEIRAQVDEHMPAQHERAEELFGRFAAVAAANA
jgi:GMP synthase (glutamine-hydrolysing)